MKLTLVAELISEQFQLQNFFQEIVDHRKAYNSYLL